MINDLSELKSLVDRQQYDKYYQDIEVLDFRGYSDSISSWKRIEKLDINWRNLVVCDLGCFHGYFAFKIEQNWASKVYGLERSPAVVAVAKEIAKFSRSNVEFIVWEGGQITPDCDVALVLNMLHHCADQDLTLQNIRCKKAIFEVNEPEIKTISKYFDIISTAPGREYVNIPNRILVHAIKK